jgi:hypothetical protein
MNSDAAVQALNLAKAIQGDVDAILDKDEPETLVCKRCGLHVPANEPRHPILGAPIEFIPNGDYPGYWLCRRCANE